MRRYGLAMENKARGASAFLLILSNASKRRESLFDKLRVRT
jgi:hypothetical protein